MFQQFFLNGFIHRHQCHTDSLMHEFHGHVDKVNLGVTKARTIGGTLPLIKCKNKSQECSYRCLVWISSCSLNSIETMEKQASRYFTNEDSLAFKEKQETRPCFVMI